MKVGDLIRHRFDGNWNEVGLVTNITARQRLSKAAIVSVMWYNSNLISDHRMRNLESVK